MPVSWQIGPSLSQAISMFVAITESAVPALVVAFSSATACAIAARTSGGRLVEVSVISLVMLSLNDCMSLLRKGCSTKLQFVVLLLRCVIGRQTNCLSELEDPKASLSSLTRNKKG